MDDRVLLKIALAVIVGFLLYKLLRSWRGGCQARSNYVPFDEMPFETVPPSAQGTAAPQVPAVNVASDLLPKPTTPQVQDFGEFAPKALTGQTGLLDVRQQVGIDTQGSSMKNANYQLRADPPNPRSAVGPWLNSTYEPDLYRKALE